MLQGSRVNTVCYNFYLILFLRILKIFLIKILLTLCNKISLSSLTTLSQFLALHRCKLIHEYRLRHCRDVLHCLDLLHDLRFFQRGLRHHVFTYRFLYMNFECDLFINFIICISVDFFHNHSGSIQI